MADQYPVLFFGVLVFGAVGVFLLARIFRLWRANVHLRALAEERVGIIHSLVESESQLQSLTDISPVGILFIDADGTCLYANRRAELLTGRSAATLIQEGWKSALHPDDRDRVTSEWEGFGNSVAPLLFEARLLPTEDRPVWIWGRRSRSGRNRARSSVMS